MSQICSWIDLIVVVDSFWVACFVVGCFHFFLVGSSDVQGVSFSGTSRRRGRGRGRGRGKHFTSLAYKNR